MPLGPEYSGSYYERQPVVWRDGVSAADIEVVLGECEVGGIAYWDVQEGGVMQGGGPTQRRRISDGQSYIIPAGALQIRVRGLEGASLRAVQETLAVQWRYVSLHRVLANG
jgi:hypothetical protein